MRMEDFNTSHVTVYQDPEAYIDYPGEFQYISCYCLSGYSVPRRNGKKFQYISCYCLSARGERPIVYGIFQYISCYCLSHFSTNRSVCHFYFNTSHVTVYRSPSLYLFLFNLISIHLMLLFIKRNTIFRISSL